MQGTFPCIDSVCTEHARSTCRTSESRANGSNTSAPWTFQFTHLPSYVWYANHYTDMYKTILGPYVAKLAGLQCHVVHPGGLSNELVN